MKRDCGCQLQAGRLFLCSFHAGADDAREELQDEITRLREQAEALATALETASDFVIAALWSSTRDNLLADIDAALRAYRGQP